jgi:hypothetical protein
LDKALLCLGINISPQKVLLLLFLVAMAKALIRQCRSVANAAAGAEENDYFVL